MSSTDQLPIGPKWMRKLQASPVAQNSTSELQLRSKLNFIDLLRVSNRLESSKSKDDSDTTHSREKKDAEDHDEGEEEDMDLETSEDEEVEKSSAQALPDVQLDVTKVEDTGSKKRQSRSHQKRRKRRRIKRLQDHEEFGHLIPDRMATEKARRIVEHAVPIRSALEDVENLESAVSVVDPYVGKVETLKGAKTKYTLTKLRNMGFKVVEWDGVRTVPITENSGLIIAVLAGRPGDASYTEAINVLYGSVTEARKDTNFTTAEKTHPRGNFASLSTGIDFPTAQFRPINLQSHHQGILDKLMSRPEVQRIASFQSAAFARWAPQNYKYHLDQLKKLRQKLPDIKEPFKKSVWTTATFNFGPKTWTYKHRHSSHSASGLDAITAAGNFDSKKSGHLILWELKMVVEFPSGSTVLIPGATVTHSHVPVEKDETRVSFMQHTPGEIFKWLDNGGRTDQELQREDPFEYVRMYELREGRWEEGLERFSTLEQLIQQNWNV